LLNYDKIESGTFSLELTIVSIWNLIIDTSKEFRLSAKKKAIIFSLDYTPLLGREVSEYSDSIGDSVVIPQHLQDMKVVGDSVRLTQMLRNLVSNALKFTPEEGKFSMIAFCGELMSFHS